MSKIDEFGKPGWIALMVLGFFLAWPVGLAVLAFLIGSGRIGRGRFACAGGPGTWFNLEQQARGRAKGWGSWGVWNNPAPSSGNQAFDEYRDETLRRLEEEEREFQAFLERLRKARDKSEFDAFMAERRNRATPATNGEPTV